MVVAPNLAVELELARTLVLARRDHLANDLLPVVLRDSGRFRIKVKRVFKDGQGVILRNCGGTCFRFRRDLAKSLKSQFRVSRLDFLRYRGCMSLYCVASATPRYFGGNVSTTPLRRVAPNWFYKYPFLQPRVEGEAGTRDMIRAQVPDFLQGYHAPTKL